MDREEQIRLLIEGGKWNEADTEFLKTLEEDQFAKIVAISEPTVNKAPPFAKKDEEEEDEEDMPKGKGKKGPPWAKANEEEEAEEKAPEVPKVLTADEYVGAAPAEVQAVLKRALARDKAVKAALVKELKANARCKFSEEALNAKDIDELETLAELGQVEVDYTARAGTAPKDNEAEEEDAPEMPAMFAKKE